ncbi:GNAT family N-acetyltransferase [Pseudonocardia alni]|uniref:GNAT family N-acetyltransferase n=1 Tax=Pseudonocardia alni TaxID=33907 RepID=UPI00386A08A0
MDLRGIGLTGPVGAGAGLGRALYEALFAELVARGMVVAVAGMTVPNEASAALHRALGFGEVGTFRGVGWKHGAWRDVTWFRRALVDAPPDGPRDRHRRTRARITARCAPHRSGPPAGTGAGAPRP